MNDTDDDLKTASSSDLSNISENQDHESNKFSSGEDELEIVSALAAFSAADDSQLSFDTGQQLVVIRKSNDDWWWARKGKIEGYIPTNHITTQPSDVNSQPDWQDEEYFGNYSTLNLQQEMLMDTARNEAFLSAIKKNKNFIKGKVVLDVGCGTGLLSMFCAKYGGAKQVYSIEASDMAEKAKKLVAQNQLSDRITIFQAKVEGTSLPEKVDLIISEWMGTLLIFEFMVESILIARDKWLKNDGIMWPSHARLCLAPTAAPTQGARIAFWDSVCGLDYSIMSTDAMEEYFCKPLINEGLSADNLLASTENIFTCDLSTLTIEALEMIKQDFSFTISKPGVFHGFAAWFTVDFAPLDGEVKECVVLDTSPNAPLTHWKQSLFVLDSWEEVETGDVIEGTVLIERTLLWRRHFKVRLSGKVISKKAGQEKAFKKVFKVWR